MQAAERYAAPDWRQADRLPLVALIAANLLPLIGVLAFDWDAAGLLILYWMENLVVGAYTLVRMIRASRMRGVLTGLFFLLHYGAFCGGHGFFLLVFLHQDDMDGSTGRLLGEALQDAWLGPLVFIQLLVAVVKTVALQAPEYFGLPLLGFLLSHGISTFMHHLRGNEDAGRSAGEIMGDPYRRIVLLHVVIIAGGMFVVMTGSGLPMLMMLVILKIGMDIVLHRREHARRHMRGGVDARRSV
jgi:hypothetical protein